MKKLWNKKWTNLERRLTEALYSAYAPILAIQRAQEILLARVSTPVFFTWAHLIVALYWTALWKVTNIGRAQWNEKHAQLQRRSGFKIGNIDCHAVSDRNEIGRATKVVLMYRLRWLRWFDGATEVVRWSDWSINQFLFLEEWQKFKLHSHSKYSK